MFVAILMTANVLARGGGRAPTLGEVGHDFLPFYAAGSLVREGKPLAMYDLATLRDREHAIAHANDLPVGDNYGPFWNPPFFALPFAPLSALPFRTALLTWLGVNLAALAVAITLLCRMVATAGVDRARNWRSWGLVPLFVLISTPFLLALTHGQNTPISLLLLTIAVMAWRARHAMLTGLAIGLLTYKPQLAAVVGFIALIDLGWRVAAGGMISFGALATAAAVVMPGVFQTYADALPRILHLMQVENVYLWERHVTLKAFWRLLLQGKVAGETGLLTNVLTIASAGGLGIALLIAAIRNRMAESTSIHRDQLIAATVAAMPLLMPFYFDYDLLLLAIPATLYAVERSRGAKAAPRWVTPAWCVLFLWMVVNSNVAVQTRVNLGVPLLAVLAGLLIAHTLRRGGEMAQCESSKEPSPALPATALAKAA